MNYKLAFDLGSTSIGWAAFEVEGAEPVSLLDLGVRIYSDGRDDKSKEPLAVSRREARGARRNRDRRLSRLNRLKEYLIEKELLPATAEDRKDLEKTNPYALRLAALDKQLKPDEIGRVLMHLAQRRGFKSNRKSDSKNNDAGPVKQAIAKLEMAMMGAGARSLGEYLHGQPLKRVRDIKEGYNFYPQRDMVEKELTLILDKQKEFYPNLLSEENAKHIKSIILFQRKLHKPKIGLCAFEYEIRQERASHALPSVQKFRIRQEMNNLDFERYSPDDPHMTPDQRELLTGKLLGGRNMTFVQMRKCLNLNDDWRFNLESDVRKDIKGDAVAHKLANRACFGPTWYALSDVEQDMLVMRMLDAEEEEDLINDLMTEYRISLEKAKAICNIGLPDGYGRLSLLAIQKILPHLEEGLIYSEACAAAGYHHSNRRTGEVPDQLPYYGEMLPHRVIGGTNDQRDRAKPEIFYGKISNPTVHIVLNQVRKLVNACIDRWGHPQSIAIELARDLKQSPEDYRKSQAKNKKDNDRIMGKLEELGVQNNYANRMRFKIWEDLSKDPLTRCCPFTGITISEVDIFSPEFEMEHLIPFSRSYDDGRANKVLALKAANRTKGNRTPFEAFGHSPTKGGQHYDWMHIQARVDQMHQSRRWRFQPDAMDRFEGQNDGLLARQLNDTRYLSRLASEYLQFACLNARVDTIPGQLTAMMRRKWGLEHDIWNGNFKNRNDHRHHAIDAFVVACTTRGMLQRIAGAAKGLEDNQSLQEKRYRLVDEMPEPYPGYLAQVKKRFDSLVISHKPDHGNAGKAAKAAKPYTVAQLHEDTAYGYVGPSEREGVGVYVVRKPIDGLTKRAQLEAIRDNPVRQRFLIATDGLKDGSKEFLLAVEKEATANEPPVRRVRTYVEKSTAVMIPIKDASGNAYKYYQGGGNAYAEIYSPTRGKQAGKWFVEIIRQFDAHNPTFAREWRKADATARLIMRLHKNDMVAYDDNGKTVYARVKKMTSGLVYLRPHNIAVEIADKESWGASPNGMFDKGLRKISVDILGRIRDPGPKVS
jgi:CRISPR-associated endonuclease Csn1